MLAAVMLLTGGIWAFFGLAVEVMEGKAGVGPVMGQEVGAGWYGQPWAAGAQAEVRSAARRSLARARTGLLRPV
ncbi:hypothetical protein AN478_07235 [Thiohalorhabdus denitrificans]|nr:hypothetical protein AN478_07235 [Thiohalorhabdus denitrificans]